MSAADRYKPGQLTVHFHDDKCGYTEEDPWMCDVLQGDKEGIARLPHQCEAWTIGGIEELTALRADIDLAIKTIAKRTTPKFLYKELP